jgi:hypothetical protein
MSGHENQANKPYAHVLRPGDEEKRVALLGKFVDSGESER